MASLNFVGRNIFFWGMFVTLWIEQGLSELQKMAYKADSMIDKDIFARYEVSSMELCAEICVQRTDCSAFSFENTTSKCLLHSAALDSSVKTKSGWNFVKSADLVKDVVGACSTTPCSSNSMCIVSGGNQACVPVHDLCIDTLETCNTWTIPADCNNDIGTALSSCKLSCSMCKFNVTM